MLAPPSCIVAQVARLSRHGLGQSRRTARADVPRNLIRPTPIMPRAALLALLALPLLPVAASAQRPLAVDARRLPIGTDSLAIYYVNGTDTTRTGTLRDELRMVEEGGRLVVRRVYGTVDRLLGTRLDSLTDVAETLEPVHHRSWTDRGREALDFASGQATGWLWLANGDSVRVQTAIAAGVINASTFDLALRASDLREGWQAEIAAFLPSARSVAALRARVAGVDSIAGDPCWRVEAEFTGMPVTFWISQRSRALRQQVMRLRPDAAILFRSAGPVNAPARTT